MTGTSFVPSMIIIIIVVRTQKIINLFINSGTVSPSSAKTPEELNVRRSFIFNRLVRRNVLLEINPGRYYLNEDNLKEYYRTRKIRMSAVAIILILLILADIFISHF